MEYNRQTLHAQYENVWLQYALSKQTRVNKATNIAVVKDVCTSSYLSHPSVVMDKYVCDYSTRALPKQ